MRTLAFLFAAFLMTSCNNSPKDQIIGAWNSVDEKGNHITLEFTKSGEYLIYTNGKALAIGSESEAINFEITNVNPYEISLFIKDENTREDLGKLVGTLKDRSTLELASYYNDQLQQSVVLERHN